MGFLPPLGGRCRLEVRAASDCAVETRVGIAALAGRDARQRLAFSGTWGNPFPERFTVEGIW